MAIGVAEQRTSNALHDRYSTAIRALAYSGLLADERKETAAGILVVATTHEALTGARQRGCDLYEES